MTTTVGYSSEMPTVVCFWQKAQFNVRALDNSTNLDTFQILLSEND